MGSVRGIDIHDNRIKEFSHSNPDIDFTKTENNYRLKKSENSFYNSIHERIKELKLPKAVRKDAVVMAQALITSDKPFFDKLTPEEQERFFEKGYEFIENRYGKENIISATIHLDEKTPHMHINFVPVTPDGRLSAKDLLNKREMLNLQNDAFKHIFSSFGLERGESRENKRHHLTVEEYKIKTKKEDLKQDIVHLFENKKRMQNDIADYEKRKKIFDDSEKRLLEKENALNERLNGVILHFRVLNDINAYEIKKEPLGGKFKLVGANGTEQEAKDILNFAKAGVNYTKIRTENEKLREANKKQNEEIIELKKEIAQLRPSMKELLQRGQKEQRLHDLEKIEKAFNILPKDVKNKALSEIEGVLKIKNKDFDVER